MTGSRQNPCRDPARHQQGFAVARRVFSGKTGRSGTGDQAEGKQETSRVPAGIGHGPNGKGAKKRSGANAAPTERERKPSRRWAASKRKSSRKEAQKQAGSKHASDRKPAEHRQRAGSRAAHPLAHAAARDASEARRLPRGRKSPHPDRRNLPGTLGSAIGGAGVVVGLGGGGELFDPSVDRERLFRLQHVGQLRMRLRLAGHEQRAAVGRVLRRDGECPQFARPRAMISSLSVPMSGRKTGRSTAASVARMFSRVCEATWPRLSPVTRAPACSYAASRLGHLEHEAAVEDHAQGRRCEQRYLALDVAKRDRRRRARRTPSFPARALCRRPGIRFRQRSGGARKNARPRTRPRAAQGAKAPPASRCRRTEGT